MPTPPMHLWKTSAPIERLLGGYRNIAFRTTGVSPDLVFKTTRRSKAAIGWLVEVHEFAEKAGFLVPKLIPSMAGNLVESGWACEPFLSGDTIEAKDNRLLLSGMVKFHSLTQSHPRRPGFSCAKDLLTQSKGGDVDLNIMPSRLVEACRKAWSGITLERRAVIHGDINPANLRQCDSGKIGILDWDECRVDTPDFDLGQITPNSPPFRACPEGMGDRLLLATGAGIRPRHGGNGFSNIGK